MKDFSEIELFNEIKEQYTNLFMLLDDCYEDDKNGDIEEQANEAKKQIVLLARLASKFGVNTSEIISFEQIQNSRELKNWFNKCKNINDEKIEPAK